MNKIKILSMMVITMLVINITLATMIIRLQHKHDEGPKKIIIDRLHFNAQQISEYDKLIEEHRRAVHSTDYDIVQLKQALYKGLNSNGDSMHSDSLITSINQLQKKIELIHYHHFQDIRRICTPEQMKDFAKLTEEIGRLFDPHRPEEKK